MAVNNDRSLQAWTCVKCGATLPAEAASGVSVTCSSCGTQYKLPSGKVQGGGVTIGGSVFVGGDMVGGDLVKVAPPGSKVGWWEKIKRLLSS